MNTLNNFFNLQLKRNGIPVTVDNNNVTGFFIEYNDNINSFDDKYICVPTGIINQGSIINALRETWICISKPVNYNGVYDKAIVRNTNNTTKIIKDGVILSFPSIVITKNMDITTGQIIFLDGKLDVIVQDNLDTRKVDTNDRFIIMQDAWKVVDTDTSDKGLITYHLNSDQIGTYDNLELEIADYNKLITYRIDILNNNATINTGGTLQIQAQLINNNTSEVVPEAYFTYNTENNNIATIDNNGLVTAVSEGTGSILISCITQNGTVMNTFNYTVQVVETDNYTAIIEGLTTVHLNSTDTYTITFYNNGNVYEDEFGDWTLVGDDDLSTTYGTIQSSDETSCTIKITSTYIFGDGLPKYVRLHCLGVLTNIDYYLRIKLIQ